MQALQHYATTAATAFNTPLGQWTGFISAGLALIGLQTKQNPNQILINYLAQWTLLNPDAKYHPTWFKCYFKGKKISHLIKKARSWTRLGYYASDLILATSAVAAVWFTPNPPMPQFAKSLTTTFARYDIFRFLSLYFSTPRLAEGISCLPLMARISCIGLECLKSSLTPKVAKLAEEIESLWWLKTALTAISNLARGMMHDYQQIPLAAFTFLLSGVSVANIDRNQKMEAFLESLGFFELSLKKDKLSSDLEVLQEEINDIPMLTNDSRDLLFDLLDDVVFYELKQMIEIKIKSKRPMKNWCQGILDNHLSDTAPLGNILRREDRDAIIRFMLTAIVWSEKLFQSIKDFLKNGNRDTLMDVVKECMEDQILFPNFPESLSFYLGAFPGFDDFAQANQHLEPYEVEKTFLRQKRPFKALHEFLIKMSQTNLLIENEGQTDEEKQTNLIIGRFYLTKLLSGIEERMYLSFSPEDRPETLKIKVLNEDEQAVLSMIAQEKAIHPEQTS